MNLSIPFVLAVLLGAQPGMEDRRFDGDPKEVAAFRAMLRSLKPGESRAGLGARFLKLDDPGRWLENLAQECRAANDAAALQELAGALKKADPKAPRVDQYLMRAKFWAGQTEDATLFLRAAMKSTPSAQAKRALRAEYLRGMARAGKPIEAYRAFPGGVDSFRVLAEQLVASGHSNALRELIAEHEAFFDDDPYLDLYRGQLAFAEGKWKQADAHWTLALKEIKDDSINETYRRRWVETRYHAGMALDALRDIPPESQTIRHLSTLCVEHQDKRTLEAILESQKKNTPYSEIHDLLTLHPDADFATHVKLAERWMRSKVEAERLVVSAWCELGKGLAVYEAAQDKREAFKQLAVPFRYEQLSELCRLVAAHRKADPKDPLLDPVEGVMLWHTGRGAKAMELLAKARADLAPFSPLSYDVQRCWLEANYQAGKGIKAYKEAMAADRFDGMAFTALSELCIQSHDGAMLEELLQNRPARAREWKYAVLVKLFSGKLDEALALHAVEAKAIVAPVKNKFGGKIEARTEELRRQSFMSTEREVMRSMIDFGYGLTFYRAAAFPNEAFETLSAHYAKRRDFVGLENLIKEHRTRQPDHFLLDVMSARLEMMRGNFETAEDLLKAALSKPVEKPVEKTRLSISPRRTVLNWMPGCLIQQGRTLEIYRHLGSDSHAFQTLVDTCVKERAGQELTALLALHRKNHPKDKYLPTYQAESDLLNGNHRAALEAFEILAARKQPHRWIRTAYKEKMIVCLVRMKRFDDAVKLAKEVEESGTFTDPVYLVLGHAASGNVKETTRLLETHLRRYMRRDHFYLDEDLGPILQGDAFKELRSRFPMPVNR